MKSYLKQDNVAPHSQSPPPPNSVLFQLDFDLKFPLLHLLLFLIDLKSTIILETFCLEISTYTYDSKTCIEEIRKLYYLN